MTSFTSAACAMVWRFVWKHQRTLNFLKEEDALVCPVSYDEKASAITFATNSEGVVVIPTESLVSIASGHLEGNRVCVYLKNNNDQSVRYRIFQFNSKEQARFAAQKINDYAQKESF